MKLKHKCDENEENPDKDIADKIDVDDDCKVPNQPMHEVGEVPSRHRASVPVTDVAANICFSTLFCFDKKQEQQQT